MSSQISSQTLEEINKCIHCGICLPECPTYRMTGLETESPRGRIHMARALSDGRIDPTEVFAEHMYLCLGCRACESACPSGVEFGKILENSREIVGQPGSGLGSFLVKFALERLLPSPSRLRFFARLLRWYQKTPLPQILGKVLPSDKARLAALLPTIPDRFFSGEGQTLKAYGNTRSRVGFLSGCVMGILFPDVHEATIRVLRVNGCEVVISGGQTCCGALNVHNGETFYAKQMARKNIEAFEKLGLDSVVVNSAGCGSALKNYGELLSDDPAFAERAREFSGKVKDFSELLGEIGLNKDFGEVPMSVTYQDPCHLLHGQGISSEPRAQLRSIPGVSLKEMNNPGRCCGSAGIYNLVQPEMSQMILDEKVWNIESSGAEAIVAPNPGCMIQIRSGLEKQGIDMKVFHLAEILDMAYSASEKVTQM